MVRENPIVRTGWLGSPQMWPRSLGPTWTKRPSHPRACWKRTAASPLAARRTAVSPTCSRVKAVPGRTVGSSFFFFCGEWWWFFKEFRIMIYRSSTLIYLFLLKNGDISPTNMMRQGFQGFEIPKPLCMSWIALVTIKGWLFLSNPKRKRTTKQFWTQWYIPNFSDFRVYC